MACFVYYWKSSDNVRHEGEIEAETRDSVFTTLRAQGIRPIRVVEKDVGHEHRGVRMRVMFTMLLAVAVIVGVVTYITGARSAGEGVITIETQSGPISYSTARPLERQPVLGDRSRIANFPTNLFLSAAEVYLARFAEPGRPLVGSVAEPSEEELLACLANPIRIASTELTEYIDLKRIVTGIKQEMSAYVVGGGTAHQYIVEAVKRQKMEMAYREKAVRHFDDLLKSEGKDARKRAYDYWLKANAQLKAMGIFELPLPDPLRSYLVDIDLYE